MIKYFCLFFLFLITAVESPAQSGGYLFYHKSYNTDDGLSSRFVQDLYQDSRNFMWISTDYGINRFDGQGFKVYNQSKYKLQSDNINNIREDQAGNLWLINRTVFHEKGVKHWDKVTVDVLIYETDEVVSIGEFLKEKPPFESSEVLRIEQDESRTLWITTNKGKIYSYTDHFTEFVPQTDWKAGGVLYPLFDSLFFILEQGRILKLNKKGELVYELEFERPIDRIISGKDGHTFLITSVDRLLYEVENNGQLSMFMGDNTASPEGIQVNRFGMDKKGRIWTEDLDGKISVYENRTRILNADLDRFTLGSSSSRRFVFFGDKSEGLWYGDQNGLNYISLNKSGFTSYFGDTDISFRKMFELSDSILFINTYRGYFTLNKYTGYYETFEIPDFIGYSQGGILLNGFIYNSLYENNVAKINVEEQTVERIKTDKRYSYAKTFLLGPDSTVLIGASSGIFLLNPKIDSITQYSKYNEFTELENAIVNSILEVDGLFYVLTDDGLYVLDWEKGIIAHHNFIFDNLLKLYVDQEGIFWIATRGGGLLEWHPEENIVHQYTMDEGLSHNIIYSVYEDSLNQLWMPSNKGLMRFNKEDKTVVTFLKDNGMKDNEFNQFSDYRDANGRLYFGGINGLVAFHPNDLSNHERTTMTDNIVVTEITVSRTNNKIYDFPAASVNEGETLVLKGDVHSANIKFSLLEYDRLESSQFYYKIEDIHDTWQPMEDRYIRLSGLPGGTHNIFLKVNAGIKMKTHYGAIKVRILKRFIHTWLFFGICALGFLILGISLSRYRIYRLDQIRRSLERKVKRRTKKIEDDKVLISQQYHEMERINKTKDHLIAIIGHDLKDYVSTFEGIEQKINYLINSQQVERIPHLAEFIENSAHDLSLLLDNLLNWALKERGDLLLHPDSIKVQSILQDVLKRLEKSISKKEINLISEIPPELSIYVDGLTLHSLLRNMIHNAIKFSHRKGIVKIYHTEEDGFVNIHIQDEGIGMAREQVDKLLTETSDVISTRGTENEVGTGMGLLLCREMLEMQSGKFNIDSEEGKGTVFSIVLPKRVLTNNLEEIGV